MHVSKKNSWKLITICWSKIMFIKTKITLGGGAMVKDLILQCEGEEFKSPHLQLGLPWLPWLFM